MIDMHSDLLDLAETYRVAALDGLDSQTQGALGQFFTPARAAALIAAMPRLPEKGSLRILDPGAGSGMLSAAIIDRILATSTLVTAHVVAIETDPAVLPHLVKTLEACVTAGEGRITYEVVEADYILASTGLEADERLTGFDLCIQNPPYAKLPAKSPARAAIKATGADAPNLYAAFLALATAALVEGGQLVAITPRSFANGPYFGIFRRDLLDQVSLDRVHVFESRSKVFADTGVLQENVIFSATKHGPREYVMLSMSNDHHDDAAHRTVPYADVVHPDDPNRFIRIAANEADTAIAERMLALPCTLTDLGVKVSTGPVVDFRSRHCIHTEAIQGGLPLIYPGNVREGRVEWPREIRKAQWYLPVDGADEKWLIPEGWYTLIKRFSAKEERRRIVAAVWSPTVQRGPVALENHLNYLHLGGVGLDQDLAYGLSLWLNSTLVDQYFRTFSGHTQVNATDLRTMRFPHIEILRSLGSRAPDRLPSQAEIDALVEAALAGAAAAA